MCWVSIRAGALKCANKVYIVGADFQAYVSENDNGTVEKYRKCWL